MRFLAALVVPFVLLSASCTVEVGSRRAYEPEPLVVLSDLENPPFAWVDDDGAPRGRDVEMMRAIASRLGRPLEWRRMPFPELLPSIAAGKGDVVCATIGITPERAERVAFSRPYFVTAIAAVVADRPDAPRTLADLAGARVVAGAGTTSERAVRLRLPDAELVPADKLDRSTEEALRTGAIDAWVMDGPNADELALEPGLTRLAEDLGAERYALAFALGRATLVADVNVILSELANDGTLADLDALYLSR